MCETEKELREQLAAVRDRAADVLDELATMEALLADVAQLDAVKQNAQEESMVYCAMMHDAVRRMCQESQDKPPARPRRKRAS